MSNQKWRIEVFYPDTDTYEEIGNGFDDDSSVMEMANEIMAQISQAGLWDDKDKTKHPIIYIIKPDGTKFNYMADDNEFFSKYSDEAEEAIRNWEKSAPDLIHYCDDDLEDPDESE